MSTTALYRALVEAGVSKELAVEASEGFLPTEIIATKADLAELKTDLIKWQVIIAGIVVAAIGLIIKL